MAWLLADIATSLPDAGLEPSATPPPYTRGAVRFELIGNVSWKCQHSDPGQVTVLQEEQKSLLAKNNVLRDRDNLVSFNEPSTASGRKHFQL